MPKNQERSSPVPSAVSTKGSFVGDGSEPVEDDDWWGGGGEGGVDLIEHGPCV